MTKLLVKYSGNWADEINMKGFEIVEKDFWDRYVEKYPDEPFTAYVGSNQDIEYRNKKDYFDDFTVVELADEEAAILKKFFPDSYGRIAWNEDFDMED